MVISSIGTGVSALGGMLFAILLARSLSVSDFGIHSALVTLMVLLAIAGDFGISSAIIYFIPKIKRKYNEFLSMAFWFQLSITSALIVFALILNNPLRNLIIPGSTIPQFFWVAALILISSMNGFIQAILRVKRNFMVVALMQSVESLGKFLIIAYLYFQNTLTIKTALMAAVLSMIVSVMIGFYQGHVKIKFIFPKTQFRKLFNFAKWIGVQRIFNTIFSRIDVILLTSISTSFHAGIFSVASRITMLFVILTSSISSVVSPRFSSFKRRINIKRYLKKLYLLGAGISAIMLLIAIFIPGIVNLIFGDKYQAAIPVFRLLTIAMIPYLFISMITDSLIYSFKKTNFVMKVSLLQVFMVIFLNIILIPHYNALAPAISLLVINILSLFIVGHKINRLVHKTSMGLSL